MKQTLALLATVLATASPAQDITWDSKLFDPAVEGEEADLILPMPCGAGMAFQRVDIPLNANDPLDDRRIRLGQSENDTGYADYLRTEFLRGPFDDLDAGVTYYYIARYELTSGQYRALQGDCAEPKRSDRLAKGELSWFEAIKVAQEYTAWLHANARDALPTRDEAVGYVRLPTETEWEYAARGGAKTDAAAFAGRLYYGSGDMREHAFHQAPGSGRGKLVAVGLRRPNPLGLYDIYGNAEELMLEPFRLNAVGRQHGQTGGIVTRGGSVLSTSDQIYSAKRVEYPPFNPSDGTPLTGRTFGLRLVIASHIASSDRRLDTIQRRWVDLADARSTASENASGDGSDALSRLSALIENEIDPQRQSELSDLQLSFRVAQDQAKTALEQSAKSTLLSGAVFVDALIGNNQEVERKASNIRTLVELQRASDTRQSNQLQKQIQIHVRGLQTLRNIQGTTLLSYRAALETLVQDIDAPTREAAYAVLREDLTLSNQQTILDSLDKFWGDLTLFEQRPDMPLEELLQTSLQ